MRRGASSQREDDGHEIVNLLHTSVRDEYKKPPMSERIKGFMLANYTLHHLVPASKWMPEYLGKGKGGFRENLYGDVFAGCTTAAFLVPQGMSYALVAQLDPIYGLYCATFPLIVYGLCGTSRQLAVGPVAIVSLILGHGLHEMAEPKLEDGTMNPVFVRLAITAAFFSGVLQLVMGFFKMGFVTRLLSHPVLSGFTSAAALIIGFGQIKHVLGFSPKSSDNLFLLIGDILVRIPQEAHWPSCVMGISVIIIMQVFKNVKLLKKLPSAMIVVVLGILVSWAMSLGEKYKFKIAGQVPAGIPAASPPLFPTSEQFGPLVTLVIVISLIGYMESMAVGMVYAGKNSYQTSPDQELIALGMANIVGSFFSCFPTAGGFGRTAVNANAGSRTQLAGIISGVLMLLVLTWLTPLFYHLPKAVLGAIVIVAVSGLVDSAEPKRLWKTESYEDLMSLIVTFFATCVVGVETGVGVGVGLSLFVLIARAASPNYVVLGHVPGTTAYHDIRIMDAAKPVDSVVILRFDADMWFANCLAFKEAVLRELRDTTAAGEDVEVAAAATHASSVRRLVLDFSGVNYMDSSAMHAMHELVHEINVEYPEVQIAIAGAKRSTRRRIIKEIKMANYAAVLDSSQMGSNTRDTDHMQTSNLQAPNRVQESAEEGSRPSRISPEDSLDVSVDGPAEEGGEHDSKSEAVFYSNVHAAVSAPLPVPVVIETRPAPPSPDPATLVV